MVVASPYAVFRANDLGWPTPTGPASPVHRRTEPLPRAAVAKRVPEPTSWATLIQADLFELGHLS